AGTPRRRRSGVPRRASRGIGAYRVLYPGRWHRFGSEPNKIIRLDQPKVPGGGLPPQRLADSGADAMVRDPICPDATSRLKYSIVRASPSRTGTAGSQSNVALARLMSGRRTFGSSAGRGWRAIFDDEPVNSSTIVARSATVYSTGLPMFVGLASPRMNRR